MHPVIASKREQIQALCRQYNVRRLDAFGSAVRQTDFDPDRSDVDFLVEFEPDALSGMSFRKYQALRDALAAILGRPVDLVTADSIENPYVRADIEQSRENVHAA